MPPDSELQLSKTWSLRQARAYPGQIVKTWAYVFDTHARILVTLQSPKTDVPRKSIASRNFKYMYFKTNNFQRLHILKIVRQTFIAKHFS